MNYKGSLSVRQCYSNLPFSLTLQEKRKRTKKEKGYKKVIFIFNLFVQNKTKIYFSVEKNHLNTKITISMAMAMKMALEMLFLTEGSF